MLSKETASFLKGQKRLEKCILSREKRGSNLYFDCLFLAPANTICLRIENRAVYGKNMRGSE
jgi:hypothetical protein